MAALTPSELRRLRRGGRYLVRADSTRPEPVIGKLSDREIQPTPEDRRAARLFVALKRRKPEALLPDEGEESGG